MMPIYKKYFCQNLHNIFLMKKENYREKTFNHHEIANSRHDIRSRHFLSMLRRNATTTHPAYHILSLHNCCHLPGQKAQTPSFKGKDGPTPHLRLDIQANLQVGAYRSAVSTQPKIILALARVSKQQSQPFMVRAEINIAESRVWGGQSAPVGQHIYGAGLCR